MATKLQRARATKAATPAKATAPAPASNATATRAASQATAATRRLAIEREAIARNATAPVSAPTATAPARASSSSSVSSSSIPFKSGLTTAQQNSISTLTQKPTAQWTATDKANWNYATNNAVLPSGSPAVVTSTPKAVPTPTEVTPAIPGVDQTGWTDAMKQSYDAMQQYVNSLTQSGKVVNPDINFDDETIARFTAQAKTELGDYYKPLFDQTASDIKVGLQRMGEDLSAYTDKLSKQFGTQLEATQEDFARRGLNVSSDRTKAETNLADTYNGALATKTQEQQRSAYDLGTAGERKLGSSFFPTDTAQVGTGAKAMLGTPGQYGFSASTGRAPLFNPLGGTTGTLQNDQKFAEQSRVVDLKNAKRELDSTYYL